MDLDRTRWVQDMIREGRKRPLPVDWKMEKQADGSASVLVSDVDQMYGTKGMARFTLYPPGADLSGEFRRGAPGRNQGQSPLVSPGPGPAGTGR